MPEVNSIGRLVKYPCCALLETEFLMGGRRSSNPRYSHSDCSSLGAPERRMPGDRRLVRDFHQTRQGRADIPIADAVGPPAELVRVGGINSGRAQ
jgi:hypothetical protein